MSLDELYALADAEEIGVFCRDLPAARCLSIQNGDGRCFIGIDPMQIDTHAEEAELLAHELGHCMTGSFYNQYVSLDVRRKHENRADFWMVTHLVPAHKLSQLIEQGLTEPWQMAEALDVSQHVIETALRLYSRKSML